MSLLPKNGFSASSQKSILPITPFPGPRKALKLFCTAYAIFIPIIVAVGISGTCQSRSLWSAINCSPEYLSPFAEAFSVFLVLMFLAGLPAFLWIASLLYSTSLWVRDFADFPNKGLWGSYWYEWMICLFAVFIVFPFLW